MLKVGHTGSSDAEGTSLARRPHADVSSSGTSNDQDYEQEKSDFSHSAAQGPSKDVLK